MKTKLIISFVIGVMAQAAIACDFPVAKCVCYPAVPFEGFQVFVHEQCGNSEGSYRYGETMHDTELICKQWIATDANCKSL